jgi:hypothetical protein
VDLLDSIWLNIIIHFYVCVGYLVFMCFNWTSIPLRFFLVFPIVMFMNRLHSFSLLYKSVVSWKTSKRFHYGNIWKLTFLCGALGLFLWFMECPAHLEQFIYVQ